MMRDLNRSSTRRRRAGNPWIVVPLGFLFSFALIEWVEASATEPTGERPFVVEVHEAKGGAEGAVPVLLIPGLSSPGSVWDATVEALTGAGHEAHVVTLAGFAGVPPKLAPDADFLPRVRDGLIDYARGLERSPAVVGHSLGGTMAFWLASTEPRLFGPIVAVDGVPFLPALGDPAATEESARAGAAAMRASLEAMTVEQADMQTATTLSMMVSDPATVRRVAEASRGGDPATLGAAVYELMTTDLRDDVARVESPVLLLAAGASVPTPEAASMLRERYAAQVTAAPDHRVVVVESARHFVMLDRPDEVHTLVLDHLASHLASHLSSHLSSHPSSAGDAERR